MEHSNDFLGTERVGRLMGRYAVPCVISLLVGALYNIVDQIFIANADYLGSYGNAANTVVFPLTVVALAIAVMVGACGPIGRLLRLCQHGPGPGVRSGAVCPDPHGGGGHRHEILPDRHLRRDHRENLSGSGRPSAPGTIKSRQGLRLLLIGVP